MSHGLPERRDNRASGGNRTGGRSSMSATKDRMLAAVLMGVLLACATAVAYRGVTQCQFVYFDDPAFVTENYHVQQGLSMEGLKWAVLETEVDYWRPLTWVSHMLDVSLFGMWAGGHHLTNLVFHILNTLLLFGFLRYTTSRLWCSTFVAALFALHPLHVESVAWVAERKDVLSAFFLFLTIWVYAWYTRGPGWGRYILVLALSALGLSSKPILVMLPVLLLLLDYWPLERLSVEHWGVRTDGVSLRTLVLEKVPVLLMALGVGIVAIIGQRSVGAMATFDSFGVMDRIWNAALSYCWYIWKMVWPEGLAVLYPLSKSPPWWKGCGAIVLLVAA